MITQGMAHQLEAMRRMENRGVFGLFMEQGTGKTWTLLADAERLYAAGQIDAMLVIAPKGVHTNWIRREIPTHMDVHSICRAWMSGNKKARAAANDLHNARGDGEPIPLRVLAMNIDAVCTEDGFTFAKKFLISTNAMLIIDESSRIKNPSAVRTQRMMALRPYAKYARIASGTPITNSPVDVFSQMEFLESGLLDTTSYRSFVAEYSELVEAGSPMMIAMQKRNPRAAYAQVVARNDDGSPRWRNLDKLQKLLQPHTFRVLKKDCLDLPEKIYKNHNFELDITQRRAYDLMAKELRMELEDGEIKPIDALASLVKLQQITSGFILKENGEPIYVGEKNTRMAALKELLEDVDGQFIIWARFKEELASIHREFELMGISSVEYHGAVSTKDRELAIDAFQNGEARAFIGQPQSGGIGITLTNAETVIYYSNDFNLETRLQSEDRAHRIGTKKNVVYIDLVATETIDEKIAESLQRKIDIAATILNAPKDKIQAIIRS